MISKYMPELLFEFAEMTYNLICARRIRALESSFRPQLVYERYAIFATAGCRYARSRHVPLILEVNYTSCSPLVRRRSGVLKPLARMIDKKLFQNASCIVVVSSYLREHLEKDFHVPREKILVCPNAADPRVFHTSIEPLQTFGDVSLAGKKVIGFVGTFSPWHGVKMLIDAFQRVAEQLQDTIVMLVGDGPEKPAIMEKVKAYNLQDRVIFAGTVSHDELPSYVSTFSVGVMPDSNEYGSPMKIFEYMAMGKPVVVPDYGPLLDAVEHGRQGMVFERKNTDKLAQSLVAILENDELYAQMAENARAHIVNKHNWLANARNSLVFCLSTVRQSQIE